MANNRYIEFRVAEAQDVRARSISGLYQVGGVDTDVFGGQLCIKGANVPSQIYNGDNNLNAWIMSDAGAADAQVYFAHPDGRALATKFDGTEYAVGGVTLLGQPVTAGMLCRFTRPAVGDIVKLGSGCFTAAPTVGQFASISTGQLAPAAALPASGFALNIMAVDDTIEGNRLGDTGYVCEVVQIA